MSYTVLSLDISQTLGWALIRDGIIEFSGEMDFSLRGRREGQNLIDFMNFLEKFASVDEIFCERMIIIPASANKKGRPNSKSQIEFHAILKMFVCMHKIRIEYMASQSWRKILTGAARGDTPGREKFRICAKLHSIGWKHGSIGTDKKNNEGDALGLGIAVLKSRGIDCQFKRLDF